LGAALPAPWKIPVEAFNRGLSERGYVDGRNVTIEYRWARGEYERLPALAAELVQRKVDVLAAMGPPTIGPAKAATTIIPIVFTTNSDPVADGLVQSMNRPGGNLTGIDLFTSLLVSKRLEIMRDLVPQVRTIGFLFNPNNNASGRELTSMKDAAHKLDQQLVEARATNEAEFAAAVDSIIQQGAGALVIAADPYYLGRRDRLIAAISHQRIPAIFALQEYAEAGGLMSYGSSITDAYRQAGEYVGRILKGEKVAELPVLQPSKFEFLINIRTAKTLGLTVPDKLLARTDKVIE
jgi:putative ABC transport system substrate-binding protein